MSNLYSKKIFKHYKHPLNKGELKNPSKKMHGVNPFCGDEVTIYVQLDDKGVIEDIKWHGQGCAISQAASSMLTKQVMGKSLDKAQAIVNESFLQELDLELSPSRVKCALLPLYTLREQDVEEFE